MLQRREESDPKSEPIGTVAPRVIRRFAFTFVLQSTNITVSHWFRSIDLRFRTELARLLRGDKNESYLPTQKQVASNGTGAGEGEDLASGVPLSTSGVMMTSSDMVREIVLPGDEQQVGDYQNYGDATPRMATGDGFATAEMLE
jgi:hypothetical protein